MNAETAREQSKINKTKIQQNGVTEQLKVCRDSIGDAVAKGSTVTACGSYSDFLFDMYLYKENVETLRAEGYKVTHVVDYDNYTRVSWKDPLRVCPKDKSVCLQTNRLVYDQLNFQMKVPLEELDPA